MYQSYANRALAHLRKKCIVSFDIEFDKCIDDCDSTLRLCPNYTKAFHRKAKAYAGLSTKILIDRKKSLSIQTIKGGNKNLTIKCLA